LRAISDPAYAVALAVAVVVVAALAVALGHVACVVRALTEWERAHRPVGWVMAVDWLVFAAVEQWWFSPECAEVGAHVPV
jgi:hypothetical protein